MATWDLPSAIKVTALEWVSMKASFQFKSPFDGSTESIEVPGERWGVSLMLAPKMDFDGGQTEAFFARIAGGTEKVRLWNFIRPIPRGTMRGTPTINTAAARGAQTLRINTTGTLTAGDFFGIGTQLFQCFADCAPVSGVLTVPLVQRVRGSISVSTPVTWNQPTALFIMPATSNRASYGTGILNPMQIDMEETYQ